jgi:PKD repeat protein
LNVQFENRSAGEITEILWDFGDGNQSAEANPLHTYNVPGTYQVTLTATGPGGSDSAQVTITALEPPTDTPTPPSLAETTPVLPDLGPIQPVLRSIYEAGLGQGNRPAVFALAGDDIAADAAYLNPFADPAAIHLDDGSGYLQNIIDWYNLVDLNGTTSFNRAGVASAPGWRAQDLLNPANRDPALCSEGETPLACELRLTQPSVLLVHVGYHDALQVSDLDTLRNNLQQIIQAATQRGVIPVLITVQPRLDGAMSAEQLDAVNEVIIDTAENSQMPVLNLWRAFAELPESGLAGDRVSASVAPNGPGDLTAGAVNNYGANARNLRTLLLLHELRSAIFPDAPAP